MKKIRVLIIDDAAAIRRLLSDALASEPDLQVVGIAASGTVGLAMIAVVKPDVVLLDLEMPGVHGLEVLASIRASQPRLPVIVFSSLTQRGATETLDALASGANDYVAKPSSLSGCGSAALYVADQLVPRIRTLAAIVALPPPGPARPEGPPRRPERPARLEVVVIGVSTGGPNALSVLLSGIPGDFPVPILIVQHMPALFTRQLAQRLDEQSSLAVSEGLDGQPALPGQAVLAPGGWHMTARRHGDEVRIGLHQGPPENSCRPSADVLFRSAAAAFGPATLGVVMTGMGQDGLSGAEEICRRGGQVIAQDEPSSVVWGMPGYVVRAGLADGVFPLDRLAANLVRRARHELNAVRLPSRGTRIDVDSPDHSPAGGGAFRPSKPSCP